MIFEGKLLKKLEEISIVSESRYQELADNLGVLSGLPGIALFHFYYAKLLNDNSQADLGISIISECIEKINDGYNYPSFCNGLAGFAWTIEHLYENEFIDLDTDDFLTSLDDFLYAQMISDFQSGNYDFLHGALGYVFYFFTRFKNTKNNNLKSRYFDFLKNSINKTREISSSTVSGLKWNYPKELGNHIDCSFGLSHGMTSIINILLRLNEFPGFQETTKDLIQKGVRFILETENNNTPGNSLFPHSTSKNEPYDYNGRVAWCYGDLGIGLTLEKMNQIMGCNDENNLALRIFNHSAARRAASDTLVSDAGFCHGSFGNAQIFKRVSQLYPNLGFEDTYEFWMQDGISKAVHSDGYAGFKQLMGNPPQWEPLLSILEGVNGIGLVMVDYLSSENNTWDECLLIS
ncbi:lanthionine synthetase C family protein [Flagellimonas meridianipacifica]|uniref:Lanthionine synthetase-like protein n=1 Tax=Flagellimonas meridianipacifica TaxID=1080225 RepID=A0A2T0MIX2_9FLAO|nr:lanthionine synthetase C family protein [Allomuricauda pacifica]PRX57538.1 lanthionine synthetase-like protein [Allomuricauda pacifica]